MDNEQRKGSHGGHGGHGVAEYALRCRTENTFSCAARNSRVAGGREDQRFGLRSDGQMDASPIPVSMRNDSRSESADR
jgi:hypothetical protein